MKDHLSKQEIGMLLPLRQQFAFQFNRHESNNFRPMKATILGHSLSETIQNKTNWLNNSFKQDLNILTGFFWAIQFTGYI